MNTGKRCQKCGSTLDDTTASGGLCAVCLLRSGLAAEPEDESGEHGHLAVPRVFGPYELVEEIGRGGMGVAYAARQTALHRMVAVKLLLSGAYASESALARFRREAAAAAGLQHPNIVEIHDYGEWEGQPYYAMDLVSGGNLAELSDGRPLLPRRAAEIVRDLADAVHYAHQQGVLHRDLKPSNVLLDERDRARIADFGLARRLDDDSGVTQSGQIMGSPGYTSPEQASGHVGEVGVRSDVYGLGAILYHLLTGRAPFNAATPTDTLRLVLESDPLAPRLLNPAAPRDLGTICLKCLAKEPARRYATAAEVRDDVERYLENRPICARRPSPVYRVRKLARRHRFGVGAIVALSALAAGLLWLGHRSAQQHWAREMALPEIRKLVVRGELVAALALAERVERVLPKDPLLLELMPAIATAVNIETTPTGAEVFQKEYRKPESPWKRLGVTPLKQVRIAPGFHRWKFSAKGWTDRELALAADAQINVSLDRQDVVPPDMVHVEGAESTSWDVANTTGGLGTLATSDFLIDRHEVTNQQYQAFVDNGGYAGRHYWTEPFLRDGIALSWDEALSVFVDATGRPGPATWRDGRYPPGMGDYPVTGVSWFEAAAYADYAGKRLPTIYHWRWAAAVPASESIVPQSNCANKAVAAIGTFQGMSRWGTSDMAGNAKEWCWNEAGGGRRYLLGGSWSEPGYVYYELGDARFPFDRSPLNGFRCMRLLGSEGLDPVAEQPRPVEFRDYSKEMPMSDETRRSYLNLFSYDKTALDERTDAVDDSNPAWRRETVSFSAAYNNERIPALLFLPRQVSPPFQTVVFFPAADARQTASTVVDSLNGINGSWLSCKASIETILQSGRAVIYPVYKGTYERGGGPATDLLSNSIAYRDRLVQWVKDLRKALDYLATRTDIRTDAFGYFGGSWGARLGAMIPAIEPRLKVSILQDGGFSPDKRQPEVDEINYASYVTIPTLMLNGRHDFFFPVETLQLPMFRLLGTPPEHKRHVLFDSGHSVPVELAAPEIRAWLDKYLGPVNKPAADAPSRGAGTACAGLGSVGGINPRRHRRNQTKRRGRIRRQKRSPQRHAGTKTRRARRP